MPLTPAPPFSPHPWRRLPTLVIPFIQHLSLRGMAASVDKYQQLVTRFPSNVHLHLHMGQVEASQGRNEEAMLHYQKACTLDYGLHGRLCSAIAAGDVTHTHLILPIPTPSNPTGSHPRPLQHPFNVACMDDHAQLLLSLVLLVSHIVSQQHPHTPQARTLDPFNARTLDPFNVACMDDYALLLLSRRSPSASSALSLPNLQVDASVGGGGAAGGAGGAGGAELRRLTAEMVGVGAGRVEAWVVAAALWMSRGERGSALAYVDKRADRGDGEGGGGEGGVEAWVVAAALWMSRGERGSALAYGDKVGGMKWGENGESRGVGGGGCAVDELGGKRQLFNWTTITSLLSSLSHLLILSSPCYFDMNCHAIHNAYSLSLHAMCTGWFFRLFQTIPPSSSLLPAPSPPVRHSAAGGAVTGAILLQAERSESAAVSGAILLQTERSESAAVASAAAAIFRRAYTQKQDLRVFQGLVRAYLRIPKLKEAIAAAREAVKAFPNSASALSLLGEVYLQHSDSRDKARKVFEAALRMDGRCGAAVTGLADAHTMDGRHAAAIDVLKRHLAVDAALTRQKHSCTPLSLSMRAYDQAAVDAGYEAPNNRHPPFPFPLVLERHLAVDSADWIHVKLGFVHMAANRLPDALHHLQTALSFLSPDIVLLVCMPARYMPARHMPARHMPARHMPARYMPARLMPARQLRTC
ncbi:unnamed protein product [Closterium sp. Naga37s-1]|nr:unnamed protein product [Closterium sp. Naga37s-1]